MVFSLNVSRHFRNNCNWFYISLCFTIQDGMTSLREKIWWLVVQMSFVRLLYKTTFNSVNQMIKLAIETDCFPKFSHVNNYRIIPKNCPFCWPHTTRPNQQIQPSLASQWPESRKKIANGIILEMTDIWNRRTISETNEFLMVASEVWWFAIRNCKPRRRLCLIDEPISKICNT